MLNGRIYMKGYSGSIKFSKLNPNGTQNGSLKTVFKRIHNTLKKVGPKIIHGAKKLLDLAASDPTVSQLIKNTANQILDGSGDKVAKVIENANDMVKNKNVDINKVKEIATNTKDLVKQWRDNNKKVQDSPTIKKETKDQVKENTDKLTEAAEKGRLAGVEKIKNANYLNLLTKSTRGGSISTSASVIKEIRDALNLPTTSIGQKGRLMLGDLKPRYLVSQITGNDYKQTSKGSTCGHPKDMAPPTKKDGIPKMIKKQNIQQQKKNKKQPQINQSLDKGDIVKKFEALF